MRNPTGVQMPYLELKFMQWVTNASQYTSQFFKKTQVYRHNVLTTWNRLLSDDDTAADMAARSFVVSGCTARQPELCYNDGGIYTV